jgi:hypothetical protein
VTSGLVNTTQQIGAALGVAVLGTLAASRAGGALAGGAAAKVALTDGYRLAFGTGAGLAAAAIGIAVVGFLPLRSSRSGDSLPPEHGEGGHDAVEERPGDQHRTPHASRERAGRERHPARDGGAVGE